MLYCVVINYNKNNSTKPDFFLIGAPRSGTTALSEHLKSHPDIFFSEPKEINYFNTDFLSSLGKLYTEKEYLNVYFSGANKYKRAGEGSIFYLYSTVAVKNILKFNPNAKFIVMLRNPVDMAYSLYSKMLSWGAENIKDFEKAWNMQTDRSRGKYLPAFCKNPKLLQYGSICKVGEQLQRLYGQVNSKQVFVIFFEDFKSNPLKVYKQVLKFLEVDYDGREDFPVINQHTDANYIFMKRLTRIAINICGDYFPRKKFDNLAKRIRVLIDKIHLSSIKSGEKPDIPAKTRKMLLNYFGNDIKVLTDTVREAKPLCSTRKSVPDWL